jgi:membrane-associated protease RseP (regulator of RpoE activity)
VTPRFVFRQQLAAIARNLTWLYGFLFYRFFLGALTFALFVLLYQSGRWRRVLRNLGEYWFLMVPALTALAMYSAINVEPRYIAPFVPLLALSCLAAVRLAARDETQRWVSGVSLGLGLIFIVAVIPETARSARSALRDLSSGHAAARDVQWQVARELQQRGLQPGDRVASIGNTMFAAWPRLARIRVVAEIPETPGDEAKRFWAADGQVRAQALSAIAGANARVVVAENAPSWAISEGWQRLGTTNYLIYVLQ